MCVNINIMMLNIFVTYTKLLFIDTSNQCAYRNLYVIILCFVKECVELFFRSIFLVIKYS